MRTAFSAELRRRLSQTAHTQNPPRIEALSHHFYKGGPNDPRIKPDRLLLRSTREAQEGKVTSDAAP